MMIRLAVVVIILIIAFVGLRYMDGYCKGYSAAMRDFEKKKLNEVSAK